MGGALAHTRIPGDRLTCRGHPRLGKARLPRRALRLREAAATASIAFMELGALVCTSRAPRCPACPVLDRCAWVLAGRPPLDAPVRRPQAYAGTDRQVRGRLLGLLRDADGPVAGDLLAQVWDEPVQRARALDGLVVDGLVDPLPDGRFALPTR